MSCSDLKKTKKRKSSKSGNMGDVLGKECGDGEKEEMPQESCSEDVREEADGAPSGDDQSSLSSGDPDSYELKRSDEVKDEVVQPEESPAMPVMPTSIQREEKPCTCEACKDRRELAAEQLEEMRRLQSYWMELRQYIRMVYRMAMEGRSVERNGVEDYEAKMKDLVQKLCARDPHQLFQRLESQVQEFVIEAKVRQLELLHREHQTPELAQIFLTGLLEGYDKLCLAAKQLAPLLHQLESEHLQRFNLTWEVLNKHLYQSCVYTDPLVQNNLPHYIGQLRSMLPGKNQAYSELVHHYLAFDDEMTLIGAMWRDTETLVIEYNQEQATLKAKQRMLKEDWELFKAQRKLIQQKMWNKTASELREFDEQLMTLARLGGPTPGPGPGSPRDSSPDDDTGGNGGYCPGCSSRRGCPCDECAVTHLLTCGGLITPPDSPGPIYSNKVELVQEYRVEGEGSEQPPESPSEPDIVNEGAVGGGDLEGTELAAVQQQSCECHVCTAPLMSPMDLMESYECHTCVQQGVPIPGGASAVNLNLHAGGFHLYPHIHGTGGGGDAGSLYPHLYNIHPSLLTQLGSKHSRLGVHIQDQLQLTANVDTKPPHILQSQLPSPAPSTVTDLLLPGMTLEALPSVSSPPAAGTAIAAGFSNLPPSHLKSTASPVTSPSALKIPSSLMQPHKQSPPNITASKESIPAIGTTPPKLGTPCREHGAGGKIPLQSLQSSASTQTSPNKAKTHLQQHGSQQKSLVVTSSPHIAAQSTLPQQQLSQNNIKRNPAIVSPQQATTNGHHHPVVTRSSPTVSSMGSSVRHSTTQTASPVGHPHTHNHQSLPDVVKSAATSTTPHRTPAGPTASKVPAHSCHKSLKNGGSIEPIKRVACTDYPDSVVVDLEDSSSQDDTCSERSSSTTTSTQRDSRHCDCCYCEVFGHGMPSVAPVSRNYQEMRERLRLLLTKKKAKCKIGGTNTVGTNGAGNVAPQPGVVPPPGTMEATVKPSTMSVVGSSSLPSPTASGPLLSKQDSSDSLPQPVKDPRDLEALLDFIEGNQSSKCKDAKKAAKKARQKQKKQEEKEKKDQEEAERLRLEELQNKTPEVTITVVNTPSSLGISSNHQSNPAPTLNQNISSKGSKNLKKLDLGQGNNDNRVKSSEPVDKHSTQVTSSPTQQQQPQMVTIKRVMEANGAEPTVTITLKGATPDKDKILFTLVNGQGDYLCQSQDEVKRGMQPSSTNQNTKHNQCGNVNISSSKKKKKVNNNSSKIVQQPNTPAVATKPQHSTAKTTNVSKPSLGGSATSNGNKQSHTPTVNKSLSQQKPRPSSEVIVNHAKNDMLPVNHVSSMNQLTTATAIQINNVINTMSSGKPTPSASNIRLKPENNSSISGTRSFSLENLKLPPGITITKVNGPSTNILRKSQSKPSENSKSPNSVMSNHSSTTIISAPTAPSNTSRISGYGSGGGGISQSIGGSNVIVVDTGKMKEELETVLPMNNDDLSLNNGNSKKKNKKKNKNQNNGNCSLNGNNSNQVRQQQEMSNGIVANSVNGKIQNSIRGKNLNLQSDGNVTIQHQMHPLLTKNIRPPTIPLSASQLAQQPAIIKVNGSMVTIRNPALQQAMSSGSRFPTHNKEQSEILMNGEVPTGKPGNKPGKKPVNLSTANGIVSAKGKENGTMPPRFSNSDVILRNRLTSEYSGLNSIPGLHISKVNSPIMRGEENGISLQGSSNMLPPRMRIQQQPPILPHMTDVRKLNQNHICNPQEGSSLQRSSAARLSQVQAHSAMREAMAASMTAANDAKKKKKKKKGTGGQGHPDDLFVESVFAPKDIDLENGDIDDDERELEAFKRFCFNSVPPKRKEKVHLNIKDIVLKKKSSAIGCS